MNENLTCDVLVIGSGGAALRAALAAKEHGAKVLLVTKGVFGSCGATASGVAELGGFGVANGLTDPTDDEEVFFQDIIAAGQGMCEPKLVRILVEHSVRAFRDLERYGVSFERTEDGRYLQVKGCFATRPRMHILKRHGVPIVNALKTHVLAEGIPILERTMATRLLVQDGRVVGAVALDGEGRFVHIQAKTVILGTGGAGQLFAFNLNTPEITGDGYALGYHAGAELMNMEFMQAGAGFVHPFRNIFHPWAWPLGPEVLNAEGRPFLAEYLPKDLSLEECFADRGTYYPFTVIKRSYHLDVAIKKELLAGRGTEHGGVFLDYRKVAARTGTQNGNTELASLWPKMQAWLSSQGIEIKDQLLEVSIFGHALNGGVRIDEKAETRVQGLFAAGESAAGPHGANRLGGNMLLAAQVFGRIAGEEAAKRAKELPLGNTRVMAEAEEERLSRLQARKGSNDPNELLRKLQEVMWRELLIVRNATGLERALAAIGDIKAALAEGVKVDASGDVWKTFEIENLLDVGAMMTKAALARKESRGSHYREDAPETDEVNWGKKIILKKQGENMSVVCE